MRRPTTTIKEALEIANNCGVNVLGVWDDGTFKYRVQHGKYVATVQRDGDKPRNIRWRLEGENKHGIRYIMESGPHNAGHLLHRATMIVLGVDV